MDQTSNKAASSDAQSVTWAGRFHLIPDARQCFVPDDVWTDSGIHEGPAVQFVRDVVRSFADKCLSCHGPKIHALDCAWTRDRNASRWQIGPRDFGERRSQEPSHSANLRLRSRHADAANRVPLSDKEIQILRTWVRAGAPWGCRCILYQGTCSIARTKELFEAITSWPTFSDAGHSGPKPEVDWCCR
jgi:hypothetical protein